MRFWGNTCRDGKLWLAEIPILDAMTQGRSRKEALSMAADLVETLVGRRGFSACVHPLPHGDFEISVSDVRPMIALLLRRQRARSGLTLQQVAERLGARSRNTYARYEQGSSQPTLEKLIQLLHAVAPDRDLVLQQSVAAHP